jgi:hypothetical protein
MRHQSYVLLCSKMTSFPPSEGVSEITFGSICSRSLWLELFWFMLKKKSERQLEHQGIITQVDIPKQKSELMCIPKCFLNQSVHSTNDNLYKVCTDYLYVNCLLIHGCSKAKVSQFFTSIICR